LKIFVSGGWQPHKVKHLAERAEELGRLLAEHGFDMTCGPGTGIAKFVIKGYRSVPKRGKIVFYLPKLSEMKRVGEEMEEGADDVVKTNAEYPIRNLLQVKESDAVVGIGGSAGTLTEVIAAVMDYHKPVAMFEDGSESVQAAKIISKIRPHIFFSRSVVEVVSYLKKILHS